MFIGLSGKASVGKDTVADYLISDYGFKRKIAFSDNLKEACMDVFKFTPTQVYTQEGKRAVLSKPVVITEGSIQCIVEWMAKTHKVNASDRNYKRFLGKVLSTPREVLQFVGTDIMRFYVPTYHIDVVKKKVLESNNIIITDVRFKNEANLVYELGGLLIRVERPDYLRAVRGSGMSTHISETMLDGWNNWSYCLYNTSNDLSTLRVQIRVMLKDLEVYNELCGKKSA